MNVPLNLRRFVAGRIDGDEDKLNIGFADTLGNDVALDVRQVVKGGRTDVRAVHEAKEDE